MPKSDTSGKDAKKQVNLRREIRREWVADHKGALIGGVVCVVAAIAAVALLITRPWVSGAHVLDQTAAIVDGDAITEQQVADYIDRYRRYIGKTADADWATFMDENSLTAESIRTEAVTRLEQQNIIRKAAEAQGISATDEEIDEKVAAERERADLKDDDEAWNKWLDDMGYDEQSYRDEIRYGIIEEKYIDTQVAPTEPTDYSLESHASEDIESYTGRRGYQVLFELDSNATASKVTEAEQKAKDFIKELGEEPSKDDFTKAADEAAKKDGTSSRELNWDCLVSYDVATQGALDELEAGKMTAEPVRTAKGYAVIYCTETYLADDKGKIDVASMPEAIKRKLRSDTYEDINKNPRDTFLMMLTYNHATDVTDMPEGLPYDVDMSLSTYHADDEATADGTASDDGTIVTSDDGSTVVTTETTADVATDASADASTEDSEAATPAVSPSDPTKLQTFGDSAEEEEDKADSSKESTDSSQDKE